MIKRGREAINESLAKSSGGGKSDYAQTNWISWKAGETKTIRFLTDIDDILVVAVHSMVDTHDGKKANFVCRSVFDAPCELCAADVYKRDAGYGIAVVRQPVYDTVDGANKIVGYEDQVVEYDDETPQGIVKKRKPVVGIVNQSMRNFWNTLTLVHEKYGSFKDFDMEIVRQGKTTDTTYVSFPLPVKPIENIDERYENFIPDLEGFLTRIGSQEYYDSRLHGIVAEKKDNEPPFVPASAPNLNLDDIDGEQTMADRLKAKYAESNYS